MQNNSIETLFKMYDKTNSYAAKVRSRTQINAMDSCPKDFCMAN